MSGVVTLLGPQRRPSVQHVARDMGEHTTFATVTAGWRERESDDEELDQLLAGRSVNLCLHRRWLDVLNRDAEYANAELEHEAALTELRALYLVQLDHALRAAYAIAGRKEGRPRLREGALNDALEVARVIDTHHLGRVRDAHLAFRDAWRPHDRDAVVAHRNEVRRLMGDADVLVLAGGHVGELVKVLDLFDLKSCVPGRVVAWSAGAMALTERLVLFHDHVQHGVAQTEVYDEGLGVLPGLVLLPHARRRLRVQDHVRMAVLARRFHPARCLVLDDGVRVDVTADGGLPPEARVVSSDGRIADVESS